LLDTQQLTTTFSQAAADRQTFYIAIKVTDQLLKLQHNTDLNAKNIQTKSRLETDTQKKYLSLEDLNNRVNDTQFPSM